MVALGFLRFLNLRDGSFAYKYHFSNLEEWTAALIHSFPDITEQNPTFCQLFFNFQYSCLFCFVIFVFSASALSSTSSENCWVSLWLRSYILKRRGKPVVYWKSLVIGLNAQPIQVMVQKIRSVSLVTWSWTARFQTVEKCSASLFYSLDNEKDKNMVAI